MVFNYGRFHSNVVNQVIHIVFVPIILYTWYIFICEILPDFRITIAGQTFGFGLIPSVLTSVAYIMVDWRVGLGMTAWWVPATILSNIEWMGHRDADYFGLSQF